MIKKKNREIINIEDWKEIAGPKNIARQWVDGRSAKETAKVWLNQGTPEIPVEIRACIQNHEAFSIIESWNAEPEFESKFDGFRGPANIDVIIDAKDKHGEFLIGVESKADESFSSTIEKTYKAAKKTVDESPNSKRVERLEQLASAFFGEKNNIVTEIGNLRYQLITCLAGTISEAINRKVQRAVFLIHEFETPKTSDKKHEINRKDLNALIHRLTNGQWKEINNGEIIGTVCIPGNPLFGTIPKLYIGKVNRKINKQL